MKICLVGYGSIAKCHMEAFRQIEDVEPYWIVGRRDEPTMAFAQEWGFAHRGVDLAEALADDAIDAMVITTPNELHAPQATAALKAGKHVLLEIPMAMNRADSETLAALARDVDRKLMICHTMRTFPALAEVHRRIVAGELHLHQFIGFFGLMRRDNTSWTGRERSWTDNILWHHAAHLVDLALWTSGEQAPDDVHCRYGPPHPTQNVMDMTLSMTLGAGVLATVTLSYNLPAFRWRATFIGKETTLEFREGTLFDINDNVVVPHHSITDLLIQNRAFVESVRDDTDVLIPATAILPTMRVLELAAAQAAM